MTFDELEEIAETVWELAASDSALCQTAIAWLVVNRGRRHGRFGENLDEVCRRVRAEGRIGWTPPKKPGTTGGLSNPRYCETVIRVLEVVAGQVPDPIHDSCRFHPHSVAPEWSEKSEPVAIIGPFIFYEN